MQRAHKRNAVLDQKFHFRRHISGAAASKSAADDYAELSVDSIINGEVGFPYLCYVLHSMLSSNAFMSC